ncbi:MAG: DUF3592 domain-containing protein [Aquamicrobium sp.]|uniref:DUF3592 domain-containing protein n=1 Tax=Aquamicrobium sp. TaxID=1872579 RepID=UPI00349EB9D0|nr:DUF3592 domain-containing protein [Aquamicrobium sp.]
MAAPRARPDITGAPRAQANRASGRQAALALAALLALAGSLLLALAAGAAAKLPWEELRLNLAARSWPEAQASIRSVSLFERSHVAGPQERLVTELVLTVAYDYEVDGVQHEGRAASFAETGKPHDRRLRTLYSRLNFALVTGRSVPVFYDPHAPAEAVLDRSFDRRPMMVDGGCAALGVLLGLTLLASSLRLGGLRRRPVFG